MPSVDNAAAAMLHESTKHSIRASDLKTLIVRSKKNDETVARLFVEREIFVWLALPEDVKGLRAY